MRLLMGQLYDFHTTQCLGKLYVGEILIPQEHLDAFHLRQAVRFIVNKYPALRTCFTQVEGEWRMHFLQPNEFDINDALQVFAPRSGSSTDVDIQVFIDEVLASSSMTPPLLRYALFDANHADAQRLVVMFHHLVCDGISSRILWRDLSRAYRASVQGCPLSTEVCTSYPEFAEELAGRYREQVIREALPSAGQCTSGVLDRVTLEQVGKATLCTLTQYRLQLESDALESLRRCAAAWQVGLSDCLLGCWLQALSLAQPQGTVNLMMWVSPHFVGEWSTPVAELVGSVSFPIPASFSLDAACSQQSAASLAALQVQRAMGSAQDFAIRHFSGVAGAPRPCLPGIGFNFISSPRPDGRLIGYRLAPEQARIDRDPGQMVDLPLSFEAEIYAQTLRISVLAAPEVERQLPVGALVEQLFERVQSMAAASC
ncbi:condensation domain-containing protein [Pseudomonas alkylphenolica]|uniref:condensation domain-containing protein n=1 Tax=Pseudomonas alkylphenolica TaxID=237609 RepID=UPI00315D03C5